MKIAKYLLVLPMLMLTMTSYALSGGDFLREPIGARQVAMGEAFTAMSGDVNGLYYNSASIASLTTPTISSMVALNAFDNKTLNLSVGLPVTWLGQGTIAIGMNNLIGADMTVNYLDGSPSETINSKTDYLLSVGYGHQLNSSLQIGATVKSFYSVLFDEYSALAFAGDLGLIYQFQDLPGLSAGLSLQNLGTEIVYQDEGDPMPTLLRAGAAYKVTMEKEHDFHLAVDLLLPNDQQSLQHIGVEYAWQKILFIRAGYKIGYEIDNATVGAGIKLSGIAVDYAFSNKTVAETIHRISVGYEFGATKK